MRRTDLPAALARELAQYIKSEVASAVRAARAGDDPDPWIAHPIWVQMGLCPSLRAACALARSGAITGVRRVGSGRSTRYLCRRSALDAYIESHPIDAGSDVAGDVDSDGWIDREMSKRGLRLGSPRNGKAGT